MNRLDTEALESDLDELTIAMAAALDTIAELREALRWYADSMNCRRGVFGTQVRSANRNQWVPDNGDTARAVLARECDA